MFITVISLLGKEQAWSCPFQKVPHESGVTRLSVEYKGDCVTQSHPAEMRMLNENLFGSRWLLNCRELTLATASTCLKSLRAKKAPKTPLSRKQGGIFPDKEGDRGYIRRDGPRFPRRFGLPLQTPPTSSRKGIYVAALLICTNSRGYIKCSKLRA